MSRFACAFSLVRTVMRRAAPPAALGLVATNRDRAGAAWLTPTPPPLLRATPHGPDPYPPTQSSGMLPYPTPQKTETLHPPGLIWHGLEANVIWHGLEANER